jgi:putative ABC transport system ATP-binding protein
MTPLPVPPTPGLGPETAAVAAQPAVQCQGITKNFGSGETQVQALRGVDLEVGTGAMTMLVGPSGCGKTTLLSVIAGIMEPTAGRLTVLDVEMSSLSNGRKVRFRGQHIGFVFQQFNLLPALTARENAAVPLIIAGMARRAALQRAEALLVRMDMKARLDALPAELSGGQQQRVAIARALVHEPRLLVCDEPTSALDAHTGHAIMELMRSIAVQPDRAVIVVTHDARVFEFADRIVHMDDGRIVRVEEG